MDNNMYMDHGVSNGQMANGNVPSVNLSVEALAESKIQEILLNGTEMYVKPLTMSEHLCKLANKIDFLAEEEDRVVDKSEDEENKKFENLKQQQPFQPPQWPWETIRNHIRQSLTEISVLVDVLSIANKKNIKKNNQTLVPAAQQPADGSTGTQYMMFDYAQKELPPQKSHMQIFTKRKGLRDAAEILLDGERRLRQAKSDATTTLDYHMQLLQLRKSWRIKRLGTKIMGDLSFKSAGSDFWHSGNFEVIKKSEDSVDKVVVKHEANISTQNLTSPISVVIGSDLKGQALLTVSLEITGNKKNSVLLANCWDKNNEVPFFGGNTHSWHSELLKAQHVLFCKELFNRLAKEAVQMKMKNTVTPFTVVGNEISASILPNVNLVIRFEHKLPDEDVVQSTNVYKPDFGLNYTSLVLLQKYHKRNLKVPMPAPSTAVLGVPEYYRNAAITPKPLNLLISEHEKKNSVQLLLERLVRVAKHYTLRKLVSDVIESCSNILIDPYIQAHWSTTAGTEYNDVTITVLCYGFDNMYRTMMKIFIGTDRIKAIMRDSVVHLKTEAQNIQNYILHVMSCHIIHAAKELMKVLGWNVVQFSEQCGVSPVLLESCGSLIGTSQSGIVSISLKVGLTNQKTIQYEVKVQFPRHHTSPSNTANMGSPMRVKQVKSDQNAVTSDKWGMVGGKWETVKWQEVQGNHFMQKFETILICLNDYLR